MIKTFHIRIPLAFEQSFELLRKSGDEIASWSNNTSDPENGYIDWKQSFWALTGNTLIAARLERKSDEETAVAVSIHKPLQIVDPVGICGRVFKKLLASLEMNLNSSGTNKNRKITVV
ncbi:MAG: hypothetical protein V2I35_08345 [Desulfocapsaceae bacterium]|jgi:hypothetical protein|nr:hypothetical protein [Desulfocapsaceae bacterium]